MLCTTAVVVVGYTFMGALRVTAMLYLSIVEYMHGMTLICACVHVPLHACSLTRGPLSVHGTVDCTERARERWRERKREIEREREREREGARESDARALLLLRLARHAAWRASLLLLMIRLLLPLVFMSLLFFPLLLLWLLRLLFVWLLLLLSLLLSDVHIYIYIYIERERCLCIYH